MYCVVICLHSMHLADSFAGSHILLGIFNVLVVTRGSTCHSATGPGGDLVLTLPECVCRKVKDMISLKMGVKFATSLNMGGKLPPKLYIIT